LYWFFKFCDTTNKILLTYIEKKTKKVGNRKYPYTAQNKLNIFKNVSCIANDNINNHWKCNVSTVIFLRVTLKSKNLISWYSFDLMALC